MTYKRGYSLLDRRIKSDLLFSSFNNSNPLKISAAGTCTFKMGEGVQIALKLRMYELMEGPQPGLVE